VNATDCNGWTPLFYVAAYGYEETHNETLKLLIDKGAEFDTQDISGQSPLLLAAAAGNKEIVEILINNGADITVKENQGLTVLHEAIYSGKPDLVDLLIGKGVDVNIAAEGLTPLHIAADYGYADIAKVLIENGADVKAEFDGNKVFKKMTPLHLAAKNGCKEVAELLIAGGADLEARESTGGTPLNWAVFQGYEDVAELLKSYGAKTDGQEDFDRKALELISGDEDFLLACESNLKNIAVALEMYSTDYEGHYPPDLDYLIQPGPVGAYMKLLPICPVCREPYIYESSLEPNNFLLQCGGENAHIKTGSVEEGHYPKYDPGQGVFLKGESLFESQ